MKGVFDTKAGSGYDDDIVHRYHFPIQYLGKAREMVGDWIIYREPQRNGGRRAYIAVAWVERIEADPTKPGHSYAVVRQFLPFDRPVPFRGPQGYREAPLRGLADQARSGAYLQGKSVRFISDADFAAIVEAGLSETLSPENARRLELDSTHLDAATAGLLAPGMAEDAAVWESQERRISRLLTNRKIRDANFRLAVCDAYDNTCAVTRLRLVNGGGKAEVQAAHIWPVGEGGPDVVQNGLALSATVHWLFDRHLISLTEDYRLLVAHNRVPSELTGLFVRHGERIHLPTDPSLRPYQPYVARHRERFASMGQ